MTGSFSNQVIIITGAGSGIGRATSIKLSHLGATLALTDINPTTLSETLALCNPSDHLTSSLDVSSSDSCNNFISSIIAKYSRLNHVFNCAGINPTTLPTAEITDAYWDRLLNTNLKGTFNITRASIPHMHSGATFVNVSSICGLQATAGFAPYCASKYAVIGFSKCLALELGPKGIRTNVVAPGYIDTPTNAGVVAGKDSIARMEQKVAVGRLGTPGEVADVVAFLMGEESGYVNGSVIEIHGGVKV